MNVGIDRAFVTQGKIDVIPHCCTTMLFGFNSSSAGAWTVKAGLQQLGMRILMEVAEEVDWMELKLDANNCAAK